MTIKTVCRYITADGFWSVEGTITAHKNDITASTQVGRRKSPRLVNIFLSSNEINLIIAPAGNETGPASYHRPDLIIDLNSSPRTFFP